MMIILNDVGKGNSGSESRKEIKIWMKSGHDAYEHHGGMGSCFRFNQGPECEDTTFCDISNVSPILVAAEV